MITTGSLSTMSGSTTMIVDSESMNSASMILIVDADSMKRGNFTDAILIMGADLTTVTILTGDGNSTEDAILTGDAISGRIGAAILTMARRTATGGMSVAKVVAGSADEDKKQVV
jgi:hypothetical protein